MKTNMKKFLIPLIILLCAVAQGAWAQTPVSTDSELRSAITNDANISVTADIDLSNSTLSIPSNTTVTINLNGHTLDRKLTKRGEGGGQVITVREGATLNLSNGTLKGGWGGNAGGIANESGTVTLNNVTITGCTGDDSGGGICNLGGTLAMTGGALTGNTCNDHGDPTGGAGIFNASGATATLTGVTVTGNRVVTKGGGGICNYGTLTLDGCSITGNTCGLNGGGIYNFSTATLNMKGAMTITGNTTASGLAHNVFLKSGAVITVTGSLEGSNVGITMESRGVFTSGYDANNSGVAPSTYFKADRSNVMAINLDAGEAKLGSSLPDGAVYYIERKSTGWKMTNTTKILTTQIDKNATPTSEDQYKLLKSTNDDIYLGTNNASLHEYYVVQGVVTTNKLIVRGPNVHIILCDNARLESNEISVIVGHTVYIHAQSYESSVGKLNMGASDNHCYGIGGRDKLHDAIDVVETGGNIEIHGGDIVIKYVSERYAAIGGNYDDKACNVTIYGGNIHAEGGYHAAGIGGGHSNEHFGDINIYGGTIEAIGGDGSAAYDAYGGAGIGGGSNNKYGVVTIWGGNITARGKNESAGIGSSQFIIGGYQGEINIYGGIVRAYGDDYGAGIGGGDSQDGGIINIHGGEVYAYGGTDAAGVGGGEGGNAGTIRITDGYVYAQGGRDYGAGIGGGEDGNGGNITITGGTVIAKAGLNETGCRAIGPGAGSDDYGSLYIGEVMMVTSERLATTGERRNMCWYRTQVRVEYCDDREVTYTVSGNGLSDTHTKHCKYCDGKFAAKVHSFDEHGICTVCGITETTTVYTVNLYMTADIDHYGEPTTYKFLAGAKFNLPSAPDKNLPDDKAFVGWVEGNPPSQDDEIGSGENEDLLSAGTDYIVQHDVNLIARYNEITITLHNEKHNGETLARYNGKKAEEVNLEQHVFYRDGRWNTLCLPFDLDANELKNYYDGSMMVIKTLESSSYDSSTGTLTLNFSDDLTSIEAGKPYIIKWKTNAVNFHTLTYRDVLINTKLNPVKTTAAEGTTVTFAGAYSPMFIRQENKNLLYLGDNNTLYYPNGEMIIGSCRAHFRLEGIKASDISETKMFFDVDSEDGINNVNVNGNGNNIFNLAGQRLSKPQKGINIINGKKVLY